MLGIGLCGFRSVWTPSPPPLPCSISLPFLLCLLTHSVTEIPLSDSPQYERQNWSLDNISKKLEQQRKPSCVHTSPPSPWLFCPRRGHYLDCLTGRTAATEDASNWADFVSKFHHPFFSIIKIKSVGSPESCRGPPGAVLGFVGDTGQNNRAADFGPKGSSQTRSLLVFGVLAAKCWRPVASCAVLDDAGQAPLRLDTSISSSVKEGLYLLPKVVVRVRWANYIKKAAHNNNGYRLLLCPHCLKTTQIFQSGSELTGAGKWLTIDWNWFEQSLIHLKPTCELLTRKTHNIFLGQILGIITVVGESCFLDLLILKSIWQKWNMEISLVKWGSVHADFFRCRGGEGCVTDFADLASACENLVKLQNTGGMCVLYFL